MARFRYRLATLLRLREAARDEQRARLAEAYQAAEILAGHLREVEGELSTIRSHASIASQPGNVDVDQLLQTHRYELLLRAQRSMIEKQQQQVADETERRRLVLVEADRQVRVLENLREKKWQEYQVKEAHQDTKLMDELAGRGAWRQEVQP